MLCFYVSISFRAIREITWLFRLQLRDEELNYVSVNAIY